MSGPTEHTPRWEWLAIAAAAFIVAAVPAYLLLQRTGTPEEPAVEAAQFGPGGGIPQACCPVIASGDDQHPVGAEGG